MAEGLPHDGPYGSPCPVWMKEFVSGLLMSDWSFGLIGSTRHLRSEESRSVFEDYGKREHQLKMDDFQMNTARLKIDEISLDRLTTLSSSTIHFLSRTSTSSPHKLADIVL